MNDGAHGMEAPPQTAMGPSRGPSLGFAVVLVVGIGGVLAAMYYWPEVSGALKLQPWARGAVVAHLESFAAGLEAGDAAVVGACIDQRGMLLHQGEDGRLTAVQPKAFDPRPGPVIPIQDLLPEGSLSDAEFDYEPGAAVPRLVVTYSTPGDRKLVLVMHPEDSGWIISDMILVGWSEQRGREYAV